MKYLLLVALFLISFESNSQNVIVKGTITDIKSGEPIRNANIVILGTTSGTHSDINGNFELSLKKKKVTIVVSHISYSSKKIEVGKKTPFIRVELENHYYNLPRMNLGLSEYSGPKEYIAFDEDLYNDLLNNTGNEVFSVVEQNARFMGGIDNLYAFFAHNFRYPPSILKNNSGGIIAIGFTVGTDGMTKDLQVLTGDDDIKGEIERLFGIMPKWYPATQRGNPVEVKLFLKIDYAANGY